MSSQKVYLTRRKSNGIYYVGRKTDAGTISWKSTSLTNKAQARLFIKDLKDETPVIQHDMKLSDFQRIFIDSRLVIAKNKRKTENGYNCLFKVFLQCVGNKPLNDYTSVDFERFKQHLQAKRGITDYGRNHYIAGIKAVFNYAFNFEFIKKNPVSRLLLFKIPQAKPVYFKHDELQKLLTAMPESVLKNIILFAVYTGCRQAEILNLRWSDIDFTNKTIHISNSESFTTKTGKERNIPFHPVIEEMLKHTTHHSSYVFTKSNGYRYEGSYLSHILKRYIRKLNLNPKLHFHSLRHTFASYLVSNNISIFAVKELLGHSSVNTTNIYSHLEPSSLAQSVSSLAV